MGQNNIMTHSDIDYLLHKVAKFYHVNLELNFINN